MIFHYIESMNRDQRRTFRIRTTVKTWIRVGTKLFQRTEPLDLSADGICLEGDLKQGEQLHVCFRPEKEAPISLQAKVVWSNGKRAGLSFDSAATLERKRLFRWYLRSSMSA